jgi:hypothetical protein
VRRRHSLSRPGHLLSEENGPVSIKVCTYAPYALIDLNGHEWAKRQLEKRNVAYQALNNGFWRCADPKHMQIIIQMEYSLTQVF